MFIVAAILGMAAVGGWAITTDRISYVITDGISMNPVYFQGDLVVVAKADSYRVGQIAAYHGLSPGQRVLHRIIGGNGATGFVLKGDNNQSIDPLRPTTGKIIGHAVLHVPKGGLWLKPLLGPSGLGMLAFLVVGGRTAATARNRREIPRGRRKKRIKAMSRQEGSWQMVVAGLRALRRLPPLLQAAAAVVAVLAALALTFGVLGWLKPLFEKQRQPPSPGQSITYSYSAKVPKSAAYDGTTAASPDPIFRRLANEVNLHTRYQGQAGTFQLTAELTNGTGWHTTLALVPTTHFAGSTYDSVVKLDLPLLTARADAASRAIGAPSTGSVTVALQASVISSHLAPINAHLELQISPQQLFMTNPSQLATSNAGSAPRTVLAPRKIKVLGHAVMAAADARSDAILLAIGAGAGAATLFFITRHKAPLRTRNQIERRFSQLLVPVEPMASPPGKPVVNVDNFPALVKLAERYGQMILTWRRPDADDFVVRDEGITYRYRVPLDEPQLQNVEHVDRPPGTGNHRRRAASEVS